MSVSDEFLTCSQVSQKVSFVPYESRVPVIKGKSTLHKHMISLITEGEKMIYVAGKQIHLTPASILLLSAGNFLYTERFHTHQQIKSTMIFFDDDVLQNLMNNADQSKNLKNNLKEPQPFALFERDDYLKSFVKSIETLLHSNLFNEAMKLAKLNELLVYLLARQPHLLLNFQRTPQARPEEQQIKQVVEENLSNHLSVSELAFLCNMSVPTFKRKFGQLYNQSPAKWLQQRRLTLAADRLKRKGAMPSEIYMDAGYENHSSFSKAFKLHFGVLPKDY